MRQDEKRSSRQKTKRTVSRISTADARLRKQKDKNKENRGKYRITRSTEKKVIKEKQERRDING